MCMSKFQGGIGFRHFGMFNRSLLAKQVWRMITVLTTLAAKLLKARYFPRSTYFDASVGYRPSYIWPTLISVKEIVCKGCKWNIGDGNVWDLGPKPFSCEVTYVCDLLNNNGDDSNHELLMSLFPRSISNKITACFVSRSRPDTLYWHNGPGGHKSAYYIALETSEDIMGNLPEETNTLLRAIWKAKGKMSYTSSSSAHKQKKYRIVAALVNYHKANERELSTSNEASLKWAKPQGDYIKINCDASWIKESGKAGLGFVARNEYGDVLLSGSRVECLAAPH
ncbi:hypothetical protein Tco_0514510 [Tanacetum coccineum]